MREELQDLLIDYLSGELDDRQMTVVSRELQKSEELRRQLETLRNLHQQIQDLPMVSPGPGLQKKFDKLLEQEKAKPATTVRNLYSRQWFWVGIAASIVLLLGIFIGQNLTYRSLHQQQMQAMQDELQETKFRMAQLMQNQSTFGRIKAVSLTYEIPEVDSEILLNLEKLLNTDESANVRLAALEALQQLANRPHARKILVDALPRQHQPVVQIALINALVELKDPTAIPNLEDLIADPGTLDKVRDEALLGKFKIM